MVLQMALFPFLWLNNSPVYVCVYGCCSVGKSCPTLCNPMDYRTPGFPVVHHLQEFAQTQVH